MKSTLLRITLMSLLLVVFIPNTTSAEMKTFIKEYTYQASEDDSRNSSRTIALREVKRLLLEELGTYLESETVVREFQLTEDQVITLTAGIVKTEIVDENWDGRTYWLKTKIAADSDEIIKSIDRLRNDREKIKVLENTRKQSEKLLKNNQHQKKQLTTAKGKKRQKELISYNNTIKELSAIDWFEKGYALIWSGKEYLNDAIAAYSKAIEINPKYSDAYKERAIAQWVAGDIAQAVKDIDRAIMLYPKDASAYLSRGSLCREIGESRHQELKYVNKAIKLSPQYAAAYHHRAIIYDDLGNYNQAIKDYNKAIDLYPFYLTYAARGGIYAKNGNFLQAIQDFSRAIELQPSTDTVFKAQTYSKRGFCFYLIGDYYRAIQDYDQVIQLNPKDDTAYLERGKSYGKLENMNQAIADIKTAARLGNKEAQDVWRSYGLEW